MLNVETDKLVIRLSSDEEGVFRNVNEEDDHVERRNTDVHRGYRLGECGFLRGRVETLGGVDPVHGHGGVSASQMKMYAELVIRYSMTLVCFIGPLAEKSIHVLSKHIFELPTVHRVEQTYRVNVRAIITGSATHARVAQALRQ